MDIEILQPENVRPTLLIGCVGYEHRSVQVLRSAHSKQWDVKLLFDYGSAGLHSYHQNHSVVLEWKADRQFDRIQFLEEIRRNVTDGHRNVQVDVTSFDRHTMALVLQELFAISDLVDTVLLSYYPRLFEEPSDQLENVVSFGPVSSAFIGEASFSRDNLALIVGAGFEYGRIVGAIDMLEPERTYCLYPMSTDKRFETAIFQNNLDFSFLDDPALLLPYLLGRPDSLYFELRRLVEFELRERNVLILPLGPKLFAAVATVVALVLHPSVMVWRHSTVSAQSPETTSDAKASGDLHRLAFRFIRDELLDGRN